MGLRALRENADRGARKGIVGLRANLGLRVRKANLECKGHKVHVERKALRVNRECREFKGSVALRVDVAHKGRPALKELQVHPERYRQFSRLFP